MTIRTAHAFDDELARWDAIATAEAIRRGDVSAEEVVTAAIRRAERLEPNLNAIVTADFDRALACARQNPAGAFGGVPTFIKDMIDVAGLPTRWGSEGLHAAPPAQKTGGIAAQIADMGMISLGKSSMPEFGLTHSAEFSNSSATHNPWNLDRGPGGSSSGAGAMVAAGVVPIAHGCDGGGSVRLPAACCGLVGLKPSLGRLLPHPEERMSPIRLVVDGMLTRSVRDTTLFFAEAERRYHNRKLPLMGHVKTPPRRRLRIGVIEEPPTGAAVEMPVRRALEGTEKLLEELGHRVEPVSSPFDTQLIEDFKLYFQVLAFALIHGGRLQFGRAFDKTRVNAYDRGLAEAFARRPLSIIGAVVRLRRAAAKYRASFSGIDVILSPAGAALPPIIGTLSPELPFEMLFQRVSDWMYISPVANVAGTPCISLPIGHDAETNLPIGMLFDAGKGQEALLLELALELEQARPWRHLWETTA